MSFDQFKLEDVHFVEKVGLLNLSAACVTKLAMRLMHSTGVMMDRNVYVS